MIKKTISFVILLIFISCKKEFHETALLLPPNFDKMPISDIYDSKLDDKKKCDLKKITKEDINDIKKLLLK